MLTKKPKTYENKWIGMSNKEILSISKVGADNKHVWKRAVLFGAFDAEATLILNKLNPKRIPRVLTSIRPSSQVIREIGNYINIRYVDEAANISNVEYDSWGREIRLGADGLPLAEQPEQPIPEAVESVPTEDEPFEDETEEEMLERWRQEDQVDEHEDEYKRAVERVLGIASETITSTSVDVPPNPIPTGATRSSFKLPIQNLEW